MISFDSSTRVSSEDPDPLREERAGKVREVGHQAAWSLSSCKPGTKFEDISYMGLIYITIPLIFIKYIK